MPCNLLLLTRNEQVSGSSPLVGSLFLPIDKPNTRNTEALGDLPGASLHYRYSSEVWVRLAHKLLPRNVSRNAWETLSGTSRIRRDWFLGTTRITPPDRWQDANRRIS
jgi:hypothetical protein